MPSYLLQEVLSDSKQKQTQSAPPPPPPPLTSNREPVIREEIPGTKRKHDVINMMQASHTQTIADTAQAVDMDELNFNGPFQGSSFAANYDNTRYGPYHYNAFHAPNHAVNCGRDFLGESSIHKNTISEPSNYAQSLSGHTFLPAHSLHQDGAVTFFPSSFATTESMFSNDVDFFSSRFFGNAEQPHVGSAEIFVPEHLGAELSYPTRNNAFILAPFAEAPNSTDVYDNYDEEFKQENPQESQSVSAAPAEDSEFAASESEDERPRKTPKLNKDGIPRKPRQPRAKLLKWSDDDWKNVCLGIVWACGETGVQIPFEQAAQVVGEKCTAGALQQALLKLRCKQREAGYSIPSLKMAWTRKNKPGTPSKTKVSVGHEADKRPRKKPTRFEATQSLIITLPRAYTDGGRESLQAPYKQKKSSKIRFANVVKDKQFSYTPGGSQGTEYFPAIPTNVFYQSPPETPFGNDTGYLRGMVLGDNDYTNLLTTEGLYEVRSGWGDDADDIFGL